MVSSKGMLPNIAAQGLEPAALLAVQHLEFQLALHRHLFPLVFYGFNLDLPGVQHHLGHVVHGVRHNEIVIQRNLSGHGSLELVHMYLLFY